jgi:hypothetical protein
VLARLVDQSLETGIPVPTARTWSRAFRKPACQADVNDNLTDGRPVLEPDQVDRAAVVAQEVKSLTEQTADIAATVKAA